MVLPRTAGPRAEKKRPRWQLLSQWRPTERSYEIRFLENIGVQPKSELGPYADGLLLAA